MTSRRSAATSRSCRARSTASRWSISTTAPRRRSRRPCSTRSTTPTRRNMPTCIAACISCRMPRPTPMKRRAPRCRRFLNAPSVEEIVFTSNTTSAINTVAYGWGMPQYRRRRRDRAVDHGASFQHRAVAFHPRAAGREAGMGAGRRSRRVPSRRVREVPDAAHQAGRHHPDVERAGHGDADQGDRAHRPCARHSGAGRRQPERGAHAGRRAGSRLRLLRLHRPQGLRAERHRRALRPQGDARARCGRSRAAAR